MARIYVGRLSYRLRERDLDDEFGRFGDIAHIALKNGYAFIVRVYNLTSPRVTC